MGLIASGDDSSYATTTRLSLYTCATGWGSYTCAVLSNAGIVMKKKERRRRGGFFLVATVQKMRKRDGDARRMLTEVSGSPAVAPIKSIHQYFSLFLGAAGGCAWDF